MNAYFVVKLKNNFYKKEISKITSNDSSIQFEITLNRLKKFHDENLKEKTLKKCGVLT